MRYYDVALEELRQRLNVNTVFLPSTSRIASVIDYVTTENLLNVHQRVIQTDQPFTDAIISLTHHQSSQFIPLCPPPRNLA